MRHKEQFLCSKTAPRSVSTVDGVAACLVVWKKRLEGRKEVGKEASVWCTNLAQKVSCTSSFFFFPPSFLPTHKTERWSAPQRSKIECQFNQEDVSFGEGVNLPLQRKGFSFLWYSVWKWSSWLFSNANSFAFWRNVPEQRSKVNFFPLNWHPRKGRLVGRQSCFFSERGSLLHYTFEQVEMGCSTELDESRIMFNCDTIMKALLCHVCVL